MRNQARSCFFSITSILIFLISIPAPSKGVAESHLTRRDTRSHWSYEDKTGPIYWPQMYNNCGGKRQSPININTAEVDLNEELDEFDFDNYDDPMVHAKIENNGHTVQVSGGANDAKRTFVGGGHDDKYQFVQLHFHWGSDSKKGSEHTIDEKQFPLEMHLVHRNTNYKTMEQAKSKEDGLAVLAVLFKVSHEDNEELFPIIDKLDDVRKEGTSAELDDDFQLDDLLPDDLMPYYRYEGSLTTPQCNEVVTWTVFKNFVHISEKQLQMFRGVKESDEGEEDEHLVDNFRPVQHLNTRVVEISGEESGAISTGATSTTLLVSLLSLALAIVPSRFQL